MLGYASFFLCFFLFLSLFLFSLNALIVMVGSVSVFLAFCYVVMILGQVYLKGQFMPSG